MKGIGKPCTGKLFARFDEGGLALPALYSTPLGFLLVHRLQRNIVMLISNSVSSLSKAPVPVLVTSSPLLLVESDLVSERSPRS